MPQLSDIARNTRASLIRVMFNEALKIQDKISFTVGEPDFITPQPIIDEACAALQKGLTHYTPNKGVPELISAIADYHKNDLRPDPQTEIMCTCGAMEALQLAVLTLIDPGDEVLLVTPTWANYFGHVAMSGGIVKEVCAREENDFIPTVEDFKKAITPKTKLVILNSPTNPTGAVIDAQTLRELAALFVEHDLFVISDEIYSKLVYDGITCTSITSFPNMRERTVYISGFSKMFAMTGWRLGYAIARPDIIAAMTKLHENSASCLPAPTQLAAAKGLAYCLEDVEIMRQSYERRRNLICGLLNDIDGISIRVPKGAFYAFVNIKNTGMPSMDFCMDLLRKTGVVIVPGTAFGDAGEGYVRITYATSDQNITEGMARLKKYMEDR
ncbi:pyridoxal phosphate-dependent aminotransferase [Oscillospiraceae bacterium MB08-C2-2]|nr:pyridoxal phosphate-dependent aminotransferase [Oscillospiraceae bacterium MB08-C2-2]